jgi:hypothetical protein
MNRRTIHRGIAALLLVTFLAAAGARPAAAAADAGFLGRLAGAWSAVTGGEPDGFLNRLTGWLAGKPAATKSPRTTITKRGWGIDPNGTAIYIEDPAPTPGNGSGNNG